MSRNGRYALVGLGSNLGDRLATICAAILALRDNAQITRVEASAVYETAPVGVVDQPAFLNAVVGLETLLSPEALLATLLQIEQRFGRTRAERWGPRTLDLDLLEFEGETRATAALQLPHPRYLDRAFVTVPMEELLSRVTFCEQWQTGIRANLPRGGSAGVQLFTTNS